MSVNYSRAQAMVLADKYAVAKSQFFEEFAELCKRYFVVDSITTDTMMDEHLQVQINLTVKKVKPQPRLQ
ncbi:MAG: hypothetical protein K2M64_02995 [Clostridia bacterium]|nr:hypothetical protein [Clostridia bacterium]